MSNNELINEMIDKGKKALKELSSYSQEQIDELCKAVCIEFAKHAEELAVEAVEETGLGNVKDKISKNAGAPDGIWYAIKNKKSIGVIGKDEKHHLTYVAHPKGIISCVIPTTNPSVTILYNAVYALKGANVVICCPHLRAQKTTLHTCQIMNEGLKKAGGPDNVFQCIENPSIELSQLVMAASDTVLGTGGPSMVKAAYSSGKPAYGVGPGNSQTIIDPEYDNFAQVVDEAISSSTFDNGIICAENRSFITTKCTSAKLVEELKKKKVYYIDNDKERDLCREAMFPNGYGAINGKIVGMDVLSLAKEIGLDIPEDTSIIVIKVDKHGFEEPLCREKMFPAMIHIESDNIKESIEIARENLIAEGAGHSSVIYSNNDELIEYAACRLPVSRVLVNSPGVYSANAALANGLEPTGTLGCGSWSGCSTSENLGYRDLINVARIAYLYPENEIPSHDDIWNGDAEF